MSLSMSDILNTVNLAFTPSSFAFETHFCKVIIGSTSSAWFFHRQGSALCLVRVRFHIICMLWGSLCSPFVVNYSASIGFVWMSAWQQREQYQHRCVGFRFPLLSFSCHWLRQCGTFQWQLLMLSLSLLVDAGACPHLQFPVLFCHKSVNISIPRIHK